MIAVLFLVVLLIVSVVAVLMGGGSIAQLPLVIFMTVMFKKFPNGMFKPHDNAEFSGSFTCHYIKQVLDGVDILELDVLNNIFRVDGVDELATYRANIGG